MAKSIKKRTVVLTAKPEGIKTHSVIYVCKADDAPVTSVYVMKHAFDGSGDYPAKIAMTFEPVKVK